MSARACKSYAAAVVAEAAYGGECNVLEGVLFQELRTGRRLSMSLR
jgi:hypothetical protein